MMLTRSLRSCLLARGYRPRLAWSSHGPRAARSRTLPLSRRPVASKRRGEDDVVVVTPRRSAHCPRPQDVLPLRHGLQVVWSNAAHDPAQMVDHQAGAGYRSAPWRPRIASTASPCSLMVPARSSARPSRTDRTTEANWAAGGVFVDRGRPLLAGKVGRGASGCEATVTQMVGTSTPRSGSWPAPISRCTSR